LDTINEYQLISINEYQWISINEFIDGPSMNMAPIWPPLGPIGVVCTGVVCSGRSYRTIRRKPTSKTQEHCELGMS